MNFFRGFDCPECGCADDGDGPATMCRCGSPLVARYDLEAARLLDPKDMAPRPGAGIWRFAPLLPPVGNEPVSLGEGSTPTLPLGRLGRRLGIELWVKDEGRNPTGTFKDRGMAAALARLRHHGIARASLPSAGNAGVAAAAYAARSGVEVDVFFPKRTPSGLVASCRDLGARVHVVDGLIDAAGRAAAATEEFSLATFREPMRLEGKKTMGYEILLDPPGGLPDVLVYPTGGGTGLVGIARAFDEAESLGWIDGRRPRFYAAQLAGCSPVADAWSGSPASAPDPPRVAPGLAVPGTPALRMILETLARTGGQARKVDTRAILSAQGQLARAEGLPVGEEAAATLALLEVLVEEKEVCRGERVLLIATGRPAREC